MVHGITLASAAHSDALLAMFLDLDVQAPWLSIALAFLAIGAVVATLRKAQGIFSRKALQERLAPQGRDSFATYFDRLDEYDVALRIVDQGARMGAIACALLPFIDSSDTEEVDLLANLGSFLVLMAGVFIAVLVGLELVPGILSRISPEGLMIRALPVVDALYRVMALPMRAYEWAVSAGAKALGSQPPRNPEDVVEEEILAAVEDGGREGLLEETERSMIEAIFRFGDGLVRSILTPRTDMVSIEVDTPIPECVRVARACGHSRIPVYAGNKDHIVGILYVKDLLRFWETRTDEEMLLKDIVREAHFVPEDKKISELFREFQTQRFHIAIVQDEFAGVSGLVTIEDTIEEVLGDIEEEKDPREGEEMLVSVTDEMWEIDARMPIVDFNNELRERLPALLPEEKDFDTVGGYVFNSMGRIPVAGECYEHGALRFEILASDDRRILRIRVALLAEDAESAATAPAPAPSELGGS